MYKMQRLEVSGAVRPLCGSLGVKGLRSPTVYAQVREAVSFLKLSLPKFSIPSSSLPCPKYAVLVSHVTVIRIITLMCSVKSKNY